jgi:UTP-glucose-1-phosphate uridylyltransferase
LKPTLLILAAGMGSRYGSMKQTEQFGPSGETITDYSIYDSQRAGFGKVVFVISPAMEDEFKTSYIKKFPSNIEIDFVIQSIEKIPAGIQVSPERKKPWGTAHAVLMAAEKIDTPFAVINADDFYGRESYKVVADYLTSTVEVGMLELCMAGYPIRNTLSKFGTVSRGVCETDSHGYLISITERTKIKETPKGIINLEENSEELLLASKSLVSMNLFGFTPGIFRYLQEHFYEFISKNSMDTKAELYIPLVVDRLIRSVNARTRVLKTDATWFGVTYKEDRPYVLEMINSLVKQGLYPYNLWR